MGQKVQSIGGSPLTTVTLTAVDDTVKTLSAAVLSRLGALRVDDKHDTFHVMISPETCAIRFAFGVDPVPDTSGKVVTPGQDIHLDSRSQCQQFRYCNAITGDNAIINIYPEV